MQGLAALLFPAVLMLFALAMEKVQKQMDTLSVDRTDVEEFLTEAAPAQMNTLATEGFPAALDEFRNRRDAAAGPPPAPPIAQSRAS